MFGLYVYMCLMALINTLVVCARPQDLEMSVSVLVVHVVFSTAGFKGGGKPFCKTRETAALRREASRKPRALDRVEPKFH